MGSIVCVNGVSVFMGRPDGLVALEGCVVRTACLITSLDVAESGRGMTISRADGALRERPPDLTRSAWRARAGRRAWRAFGAPCRALPEG